MAYVRIAPLGNAMAVVGDAVLAMVYRAYAIRPYKRRKTIIAHPFPNSPKNYIGCRKNYVLCRKNYV